MFHTSLFRTQLSLLQRQNDSLLADVRRLEGVLHARRSSVSTGAQTVYDPSVVSPVASPLHTRRSGPSEIHTSGVGVSHRQRLYIDPPSAAAASHGVHTAQHDSHDQQRQQQHKEQQQHQQQQLLALQQELALAQHELFTARSESLPHVALERQQREEHVAAAAATSAAAAAGEVHKAGLDAILERLGSWDADVLAEVYRNGQLTAMYAPQQLQQHQQQLLTAPASVSDVSISMKCVIRNQRQPHTRFCDA